jgi:serine/threonine-protein kinase
MKVCPNCQTKYPDDANFCPQEGCATAQGPRRLDPVAEAPASRYRLESQLGGARSGEAWQAVDNQTGGLVVYKRVASASLPTSASLERAQRELKQLQRAQSPRLARVLDFGKEADGRLFVVTELCEGQPLDRLVAATGAFPLERTKKLVAQIGEALLEGQKVGVVHHDLAAKNVLVSDADEVKVINFVAPVAVTETVFGVPEYLSPEQAEGKLVDQRSNTYSLGAIMTLLLTGQAPVSGSDTASVLDQVAKGTVVPPSQTTAGLTPEMDRVILKAMDKSPNRRPLTMRQFLSEVSALVGAGAGAGNDANRGVGFAKTMMFTGGSPEVQKLVNQAVAARGDANGASAPAPAAGPPPADPGATPPPTAAQPVGPRRTHGAAVAATMVALPAVGTKMPGGAAPSPGTAAQSLDGGMAPTPPPVVVTPEAPPAAAPPSAAPKPAAGGNFRETLWFKKGDVDQMVAEARARVEASRGKPEDVPVEAEAPTEDARPLEERYVDDGSVTTDDRKKFSLRSGGTATALPAVGNVPGERMSESEMMGEIGGRKRLGIILISVAVVLALIVAVVVGFRGKNAQKGAAVSPPATEPAPPAPTEPAQAPAKPAEAAAAAPEKAEKAGDKTTAAGTTADKAAADEGQAVAPAPKPKAPAAKKHVAAKKPKGKKHK